MSKTQDTPELKIARVEAVVKKLLEQAAKNRQTGKNHPDPPTARHYTGVACGMDQAHEWLSNALSAPYHEDDWDDGHREDDDGGPVDETSL